MAIERTVIRRWTTDNGGTTWRAVRVADGAVVIVVLEMLGSDAAGGACWRSGIGDGWERRAYEGLLLQIHDDQSA